MYSLWQHLQPQPLQKGGPHVSRAVHTLSAGIEAQILAQVQLTLADLVNMDTCNMLHHGMTSHTQLQEMVIRPLSPAHIHSGANA